MAKIPTLDQLSTYADIVGALGRSSRQCVWYKPRSEERCTVELVAEDIELVFKLMGRARQLTCPDRALAALTHAVRKYCCDSYHRDVVKNSRLDQKLARKWYLEMREAGLISDTAVKAESNGFSNDSIDMFALTDLLGDLTIEEDEGPFRRHKRPPGETVASKLLQRVPKKELEASQQGKLGYIYMFSQKIFPGMVKIGYSNKNVQERLTYWSKCGHGQPCLVASFSDVRQARLVETLIHHELSSYWRREHNCMKHKCAHKEWFEIESIQAVRIARDWIDWMNKVQPYDELGDLNPQWRTMIRELVLCEVYVTSELLKDLHALREDDHFFDTLP